MSPEQEQLAKNRVLLDTLRQHGDALVRPRPVRHWIYFSDPTKRYGFVTVARSLGYNADCVSDDKLGARPHRALLTKIDRVDPPFIDQAVLALFRLAGEHHGEHDGWECALVR